MLSNFSDEGLPIERFQLENIPIDDFIEHLQKYKSEGKKKFGISVTNRGRTMELYPILEALPPSTTNDDEDQSIINLKF